LGLNVAPSVPAPIGNVSRIGVPDVLGKALHLPARTLDVVRRVIVVLFIAHLRGRGLQRSGDVRERVHRAIAPCLDS